MQEHFSTDFPFLTEHRHLFCDILELSYISRPLIFKHDDLCILAERNLRQPILFSHLHRKKSEEQKDIISSFTERRHLDRNGIQTIIEIFAEATFTNGLAHVDIRSCHYSHISLSHFLSTYADIFTGFQHTEQSGLCLDRQLAHLIEENGSLIGDTEISFTFSDCSRKGTFLMTEEFAIDSSFRNTTAVDSKILFTAAWRMIVDNTRNDFLTHTRFTDDKHRKICRCHL